MNSRLMRLFFKTRKASRNSFISRRYFSVGKMKARRSINSNNSANRHENSVDNDQKQTNSFFVSGNVYDEEYPPLSSSKVQRRIGIDLGTGLEKKSVEEPSNACLLQQAALSKSQLAENSLPTQFGKKNVASPNRRQKYKEQGYAGLLQHTPRLTSLKDENSLPTSFGKKYMSHANRRLKYVRGEASSGFAEKGSVLDPFDICLPNGSELQNYMANRIEIEYPIVETRQVLRPGMVLLTNYISLSEQVQIINKCRELGLGPGGFYQPGYHYGAKLRLRMMCLGKRWDPETKYEIQNDDLEPLAIPAEYVLLVERALFDSHSVIKKIFPTSNVDEILPGIFPDICIVNFYTTNGKLGLHQDRDESRDSLRRGLPVVSFSLGDSAEFLYGDQRDMEKAERIMLHSGDVLIFGGESRHIFHGVTSIIPNSAPRALLQEAKLRPGRLNLTFRQF